VEETLTITSQDVCAPILDHARCRPGKVAILAVSGNLTYGELAHAVLSLADAIAETASCPRYAVVACESKQEAVIGILGALAAGLCVVPLHAGQQLEAVPNPVLHEGYILIGDGVRALSMPEHAPPRHHWRRVLQPRSAAAPAWRRQSDLPPPQAPAYVLMTSGSTGQPKAVVQTHAGLAGNIAIYTASVGLEASDIVSFLPAYSVDAGLMDLFGALVAGATLAAWETALLGTEGLYEWLAAQRVTVLHGTPSVLDLACRGRRNTVMADRVRAIVFGGEVLHPLQLDAVRRHFPASTVYVNGLGPSECTVALQHHFAAGGHGGRCPVGQAIPGVRAMVLDKQGDRVVPPHPEAGELVIFSPYLALGYLGDETLTAARFRDFPEHGRGYVSGDLVRRGDDGLLHFCGRSGRATKVAGVFVDLDDIQRQLAAKRELLWSFAAISPYQAHDAGVLAIAFVRRPESRLSPADIEAFLRTRFPSLPVVVRALEFAEVPLTASGKVDHRRVDARLAALEAEVAASATGLDDPTKDPAAALRSFWSDALGHEPRPESNFYADGGTSLMLMHLLTRLGCRLDARLITGPLITKPVFADIERLCRSAQPDSGALPAVVDTPHRTNPYVQATLNHVRLAEPCLSHIQVASHELSSSIGVSQIARALEAALSRTVEWRDDEETGMLSAHLPWKYGSPLRIHAGRVEPFPHALAKLRRLVAPADTLCAFLLTQRDRDGPAHLLAGASHIHLDGAGFHALMSAVARAHVGDLQGPIGEASLGTGLPSFAWPRGDLVACATQWARPAHGFEAPLLPSETSVPAIEGWSDFRTALLSETLDVRSADIAACARRHAVSLPTLLLASWVLALHRLTGQAGMCIGIPVDLRSGLAQAAILDNYTNAVPARFVVEAGQSIASFLAGVQASLAESLVVADVPYPELLRMLKDTGAGPDYRHRVLFTHRVDASHADVLTAFGPRVPMHVGYSSCEISIGAVERQGRITIDVEHAVETVPSSAAEALRRHALEYLRSLMALPSQTPLSNLTGGQNAATAFSSLRGPRVEFDPGSGLSAAVAAVARALPEACAVVEPGRRCSYAELVAHVRDAEHRLSATLGGAGEGLVFVRQEAGFDYVATCLACEALGLTFVPVDEALSSRLRPDWTLHYGGVAVVEQDGSVRALPSPLIRSTERALYAMFTSGSTGLPKLASNTSKGLHNRFDWMSRTFRLARPVTLQTTGHVYDSSLWQLLWPLTQGGTAVVPRRVRGLVDRDDLLAAIDSEGVNLVDFVPSVLATYMNSPSSVEAFRQRARSLQHVIIGGEAFSVSHGVRLQEALPNASLWNLYGPTEAAIGSIFHRFTPDYGEPLPLGVPMQNTGACVLDSAGRVLQRGQRGEIALFGDCIGVGYVADVHATRERFRTLRIEGQPVHAYLTGDTGSVDLSGLLHYHGRQGRTVKVRGQWVDLAELELSVQGCCAGSRVHAFLASEPPSAVPAVVVAVESSSGEPQALDSLLQRRPGMAQWLDRICTLERFPLSPSGKVDARGVEAACRAQREATPAHRPPGLVPRDALRARINQCWCTALGTDRVRMDRSFFDQGGNSLLLLTLVDLLRAEVHPSIRPLDVFRHPTIAALSLLVRQRLSSAGASEGMQYAD
jgi:non-ribosomal peptide synthetase component F